MLFAQVEWNCRKNNRVSTVQKGCQRKHKNHFLFNSSHYWGGQLEEESKKHGSTRGLRSYSDTRWYSLILSARSLLDKRYVNSQISCNFSLRMLI